MADFGIPSLACLIAQVDQHDELAADRTDLHFWGLISRRCGESESLFSALCLTKILRHLHTAAK